MGSASPPVIPGVGDMLRNRRQALTYGRQLVQSQLQQQKASKSASTTTTHTETIVRTSYTAQGSQHQALVPRVTYALLQSPPLFTAGFVQQQGQARTLPLEPLISVAKMANGRVLPSPFHQPQPQYVRDDAAQQLKDLSHQMTIAGPSPVQPLNYDHLKITMAAEAVNKPQDRKTQTTHVTEEKRMVKSKKSKNAGTGEAAAVRGESEQFEQEVRAMIATSAMRVCPARYHWYKRKSGVYMCGGGKPW
ncbi:hypothetical protein BAUCODRAFT_314443 [Baudoinia panamericana UAMH 10762]|uniref:Uncharacterized protein n=1 Tax=Baudoinia panamericana (strain UAMH 10762) TaxID=717646 RepID=M2MII8_BAUPA|nr:uncharacterized protein BAUCODRAFT_314443 [Baudoinia panamericana UAMH 10762]EMC91088.1 hypothetical protein BAUCODRAFT_314443 [Baudoinia panamericana UAMH 10762]